MNSEYQTPPHQDPHNGIENRDSFSGKCAFTMPGCLPQ